MEQKYSADSFEGKNNEERILQALTAICNELDRIHDVLFEIKEKRD